MKKTKNFIISSLVLVIAFLTTYFRIDISKYLDKLSNNLGNTTSETLQNIESSTDLKKVVTLEKCVDGDTASFNIDGKKVKIRFLAIDTPESVHPYKEVEEYGKDASEYTCSLLTNAHTIEIEYENNLTKEDKYGRKLAWIWVDEQLIQKKLLEIGYAEVKYVYAKYTYLDELYSAQEKAKKEKRGLWYDYSRPTYENKMYTVTFKVANKDTKVDVKEGKLVDLIDNPTKKGYVFGGWTYGGQPYDLSNGITRNITLKASFTKK